jgi:hypothetical protein
MAMLAIPPALALLRIYSIARGVLWLSRRGGAFRDLLAREQAETTAQREELLRLSGGSFFPFGSKAYRLARAARTAGRGRWRHLLRVPLHAALMIWRYPIFVLVMATYLVALTISPVTQSAHLRGMAEATGLIVGLAMMLGSILLAAEAFVSITVVGSYGATIHAGTLDTRGRSHIVLTEMQAFVGAVFTAHVAAVGTMYLVSVRIEPYAKLPGIPGSAASTARRLLDCSYYALFTLLGANDPEPQGPIGKVATGAIGLQSFALLFVVLGVVASVRHAPAPPVTRSDPEASSHWVRVTPDPPIATRAVARQLRLARSVDAAMVAAATVIVVAAVIRCRARPAPACHPTSDTPTRRSRTGRSAP